MTHDTTATSASRRRFLTTTLASGAGLAATSFVPAAARAQGGPDPLITEVQPWASSSSTVLSISPDISLR